MNIKFELKDKSTKVVRGDMRKAYNEGLFTLPALVQGPEAKYLLLGSFTDENGNEKFVGFNIDRKYFSTGMSMHNSRNVLISSGLDLGLAIIIETNIKN